MFSEYAENLWHAEVKSTRELLFPYFEQNFQAEQVFKEIKAEYKRQ